MSTDTENAPQLPQFLLRFDREYPGQQQRFRTSVFEAPQYRVELHENGDLLCGVTLDGPRHRLSAQRPDDGDTEGWDMKEGVFDRSYTDLRVYRIMTEEDRKTVGNSLDDDTNLVVHYKL